MKDWDADGRGETRNRPFNPMLSVVLRCSIFAAVEAEKF